MIKNKYIMSFIFIFLFCSMAFNAELMMESVKNAMYICYNSVIPSLYIFMIFSSYFSKKEFMNTLSYPLRFYGKLIRIEDKKYSTYLLLSLFGGFVIGANFLNELKKDGYNQHSLNAIAPSLINNSFSFCVYAIGVGLLKSLKLGVFLFISLTVSSLITSFILSYVYKYDISVSNISSSKHHQSFVECINNSVQSILSVCGFVILFYCLCEVISLYIGDHALIGTLASIFTEVTTGCIKSIEFFGGNPIFICICLSIFPLSTICQVVHFTGNSDFIKPLLLSRIIHIPMSVITLKTLLILFPIPLATGSNYSIVVKSFYNTMEISSTLFLITIIFLLIFDNNKLFTKNK